MKFRGVDAAGDWLYGQGVGSYAQAEAAIALDIAARVRSRKGNCFFAVDDGVDYTNLLEKGRKDQLVTALTNEVLQTPGVVRVKKLDVELNPRTRRLRLTLSAQTIYSPSFVATIENLTGAPSA